MLKNGVIAIWEHGKCIRDFPSMDSIQPNALDCQTYCKTMEKDAFTFHKNSTCQIFRIRSFEKIKFFDNSNCISAHISAPESIYYRKQAIYIGYMYRKIRTRDGVTCTEKCNYDHRCMSVTFHADRHLCMMKNHLQFEYKKYGNPTKYNCADIHAYMFKV